MTSFYESRDKRKFTSLLRSRTATYYKSEILSRDRARYTSLRKDKYELWLNFRIQPMKERPITRK